MAIHGEIDKRTGKSYNPLGTNGHSADKANLRRLVREHTESAINTIVEIMNTSSDDSVRLAAARDLLDRGWGKPANQIEIQQTDMHMITAMNREQIMHLLPIAMRKLAEHEEIVDAELKKSFQKIAK